MPKVLSTERRAIILHLHKQQKTQRQIAAEVGCSQKAVYTAIKTWTSNGSLKPTYSAGRPKKTTIREDRYLVRRSLADRHLNSTQLCKEIKDNRDIEIHPSTVRRRLLANGLKGCKARRKPLVSEKQRKRRLEWAKDKRFWTKAQWQRVLFSDESTFTIQNHSGNCYVRRRPGEEYSPACMLPTIKHPTGVMVWGCMTAFGVGRLSICEGVMNGDKYIKTMEDVMLPSARSLFTSNDQPWYYQDDNAPCHRAKRVKEWMTRSNVRVIDWPAQSPDLNPIENLWQRIGVIVSKDKPKTKRELIEKIIHAWHHIITPEELRKLVNSMPRRCQMVIKNKGWPIKY